MKVQPAQNLVRNAIDTCRFGFNDKETLVYNLQPGFGPKSQSSVYRHPFSAFAGDRKPPVSGKLSAALFFSNFQVGGLGQ
jgi:hypothetical protein